MITENSDTMRQVAQYAPPATRDAIHAMLPDSYIDIDNAKDLSVPGVEDVVMRRDMLRKLSADARAVVAIILDAPVDMLNLNDSFSLTRLSGKLKKEFGWTWSRIGRVRQELTDYANALE